MVVPAFVRNSFSLWMRLNASHYGCSLNVLTVRRYIVDDLRGPKIREDSKTPAIPEQPATKLSYKGFVSIKLMYAGSTLCLQKPVKPRPNENQTVHTCKMYIFCTMLFANGSY